MSTSSEFVSLTVTFALFTVSIRLPACVNANPSGDKLGKQFNMWVNIWNNGIQTKTLLSMKRKSGILIHYADCCRKKPIYLLCESECLHSE